MYELSSEEATFESFVAKEKETFEAHVATIPGFKENPDFKYSFEEETFNELPVLIHQRNFEGMLGDVQEAHVWIGGGKIIEFSAEGSPDFKSIIASVRRP